MKVLVVDDEPVVLALISRMLDGEGHVTSRAERGRTAVDMARREKFEMAFLDMGLPDVKGEHLLSTLHQLQPEMKIVVVSGGDMAHGEPERLREMGAWQVLPKPFDVKQLRLALA